MTAYADWKPTPEQIAVWISTRTGIRTNAGATVDQTGETLEWDETTRPTLATVTALIELEAEPLKATVGEPCNDTLAPVAKKVAGYRVCAAIEADRRSRDGDLAHQHFTEQADAEMTRLEGLVKNLGGGDEPGPADQAGGGMVGSFPCSPLAGVRL